MIRRASKIEACGLLGAILAPRQLRTAKMMFLGRSWPPQKEPFWKSFRLMLPSRGALRLKIEDFGGVWLQSFFCRDFASFLEGSWAVKTLILHGRGSKNHNFTEVRILVLFGSILGVFRVPFCIKNRVWNEKADFVKMCVSCKRELHFRGSSVPETHQKASQNRSKK